MQTVGGSLVRAGFLVLAVAGLGSPGLAQTSTTEVAPGVTHLTYNAPGPNVVNVVRMERDRPELMLEMGFPHGRRNFPSRQTTSTIASIYHDPPEREVLAAVNGSFFGDNIDIVGSLATRSSILDRPDTRTNWPTFVWTDAGEPYVSNTAAITGIVLTFADGSTTGVDRFNMPRLAETLAFYTDHYGPSTANIFEGTEVIVENGNYPLRPNKHFTGTVTAVRTGGDSLNNAIPPGGFVLAGRDSKADLLANNISVGDTLTVRVGVNDWFLNNTSFMIDGAGWILRDGSSPEHLWTFSANFLGRHPRTLLAYNDDYLFLVAIDGRSTSSVGMSFTEMATWLSGTLGATDAVNLDGGGSTTMVVNDSLVNTPSGGSQRPISNAVLLVRETAESAAELTDDFAGGTRSLSWDDKFTLNAPVATTPPPPGASGYAMVVLDPAGGLESARVGERRDRNRLVEADVYLDYRPDDAAAGFERYGLFIRDDGHTAFTNPTFGGGNAYVMTYDSNDGRLRAGKIVDGELIDFLEDQPLFLPESGWFQLRIVCYGQQIGYFLDDELVIAVADASHTSGFAGAAYREHLSGPAELRGARVANFRYAEVNEPPHPATSANWMLH